MNDMPRCFAGNDNAERVGPVHRDAWTGSRLLLLATTLLIVAGCASKRHCIDPTDCVMYPDSVYYGYYATCWAAFPPDWEGCPPILPPDQVPVEPARPAPGEEIELETMPVPAARNYNRTRYADNDASPPAESKTEKPQPPSTVVEPKHPPQQAMTAPVATQSPKTATLAPQVDGYRTVESPKPRAQRPMARPAPREPVPAAPVALSPRQSLKRDVNASAVAAPSDQHEQPQPPAQRPAATMPRESKSHTGQGPAIIPFSEKRPATPHRAGSIFGAMPSFNGGDRHTEQGKSHATPPTDDVAVEYSSRRHHGGWQDRPAEPKQAAPAPASTTAPQGVQVERSGTAMPIEVTPATPKKNISSEQRELSALKASFTSGTGEGVKTILR